MQGYHDLHPSLVRAATTASPASLAALFDVDNTLMPGRGLRGSVFPLSVAPWSRRMARVEAQCRPGWSDRVRPSRSIPYGSARSISKEKDPALIEACARDFIQRRNGEEHLGKGRDRLEAHRQSGHQLILISGAPDFLITPLAETLNVSTLFAARIECRGDRYTGAVIPPLPYGIGKRQLIVSHAQEKGLELTSSFAYGDSPGDTEILDTRGVSGRRQPDSRHASHRARPRVAGRGLDLTMRVTEIFHSIQGESSYVGQPCVFVRLTGCPLRCTWCDTEYAFYGGTEQSQEEILSQVQAYGCELVEVTGGEPLAQPDADPLISALCERGYRVLVETSGAIDIAPVDERAHVILDVKCPGSGMTVRMHWPNLDRLTMKDEAKFVLADRTDYEWARHILAQYGLPGRCTVLMSPVFGALDPRQLAEWVLADRLPVRLQIQLHKLIWTPDMRGV